MIKNTHIAIIGGSSGMGLAIARAALEAGAHVIIGGRNRQKLNNAAAKLGIPAAQVLTVDIGDKAQVTRFFAEAGTLDHIVVTAADLVYGPFTTLDEPQLQRAARSKFFGPYFVAQEGGTRLPLHGSLTFITGIAAKRPMKGGSAAAALNSGLEGLVRALALELAPVRVNAVSPGWVDTPIWDLMPGMTSETKQERFAAMAERLPVGRTGVPEDIAQAVLFAMSSGFTTGAVIDVDGGHRLA
ncbi:MAG TPA: SDR family oxidoreductase [Rickettsiales bacterium]|nr:SDR family oxidoreductase [Rickettsiales bacterium]